MNVTVRYGMGRRAGAWTSEPEDLPDDGYCRKGAENPDGDGQNAGRMLKRSGTRSGVPLCCLFLGGWKRLFLFLPGKRVRRLGRTERFCAPPFPTGPVKKKEEFFMSKWEMSLLRLSALLSGVLAVPQTAWAMHIMEGYLPGSACVLWGALCLPFVVGGVLAIRRTAARQPRGILLLAMAGAFIFVISSLKIPSVTGSCSHMTGTGLAAILFGPLHATVLGLIVLLFQALLLAHGGLTTLGANTFSMAVAGPVVSWAVWQLCRKGGVNRKVSVFLAAFLGDLLTYCVTSLQLALAYPAPEGGVAASAVSFLGVFAPTQLPLAVIEGILTVLIVMGMESYAQPELREIGFIREGA